MNEETDDDVSSSLRTALRERSAPAPGWNLDTVKARGRRRRHRARLVPVAVGLVVVTGVGVAASTGTFARLGGSTTTTVAAAAVDAPEEVVRGFLAARMAGVNDQAYNDFWVPGVGQRIDVTAEKLTVHNIVIGAAQPYSTSSDATRGWSQAVSVPVSYEWDTGTELTIGKYPTQGTAVLVRNGDTDVWRIVAVDGL